MNSHRDPRNDGSEPHPFPLVAEAYTRASDEVKREVFAVIQRSIPDVFGILKRLAKLDRGGIRSESLAKRPQPYCTKLDAALVKGNQQASLVLKMIVSCYLDSRATDLEERLDGFEAEGLGPVEMRDALAERLAPDGDAILLASAIVEFGGHECGRSLPEPLNEIPKNRRRLHEIAGRLRAVAEGLDGRCQLEWGDAESGLIAEADRLCGQIRGAITSATERLGMSEQQWNDRESLKDVLEELAGRLDDALRQGSNTVFLEELAESVSRTEMRFPGETIRRAADQLKQDAAEELRLLSKADRVPEIPGPKGASGFAWLRSVATLSPESKAEVVQEIRLLPLPHFAEFLETVHAGWIPDEESAEGPAPGAVTVMAPAVPRNPLEPPRPQGEPAPPEDGLRGVRGGPSEPPSTSAAESGSRAEVATMVGENPSSSPVTAEGSTTAKDFPALPDGETPDPVETPRLGLAAETAQEAPPEPASSEGDPSPGDDPVEETLSSCPERPIEESARACLEDAGFAAMETRGCATSLVFQLLGRGRTGLAYQLASCFEQNSALKTLLPPVPVLRALCVTTALRSPSPSAIQQIQGVFSDACPGRPGSFDWAESETWRDCVRLLLLAATLPMALRSPLTAADEVLKELHLGKWPGLRETAEAIRLFAQNRIEISWEAFAEDLSRADWERRIQESRQEADRKWEQALARTSAFQAATEVWKCWLKPGELLHRLLDPIRSGDYRRAPELAELITQIEFEGLVKETQATLGHRTRIIGGALKALKRLLEDLISFTQDWVRLANSEPKGESDFFREELRKVRHALHAGSKARQELAAISATPSEPLALRVAAAKAVEAIDSCFELFERTDRKGRSATTVEEAESDCLLEVPSLHLDESWNPRLSRDILAREILSLLASGGPDPLGAFAAHCEAGDHLSSGRLLERMRRKNSFPEEWESLEQSRNRSLEAHRAALVEVVEDIEGRLSAALRNGLVRERTLRDGLSAVEEIRRDLRCPESLLDFFTPRHRLAEISGVLDQERSRLLSGVRSRLDRSSVEDSDRRRIEDILERGDLHLANDYLDKIEDGEPLPEGPVEESDGLFLEVFGNQPGAQSRFHRMLKWLSETPRAERSAIEAVEGRAHIAGFDLRGSSGKHSREFAETLKIWFSLKEAKKLTARSAEDISRILRGIGFNVINTRVEARRNRFWAFVDAEPLVTPPVPAYGTEARGRYRILCEFNLAGEKELKTALDSDVQGHGADLVFFFGRMTEKVRQDLGQILRKERRTVAVVDDIVMLSLASVRGRKLDALLELTLPFSGMMPYTTQGSLLPPEMFFGRRREVAALESTSTDSSCLLYGGRQIGKTVLLRHVEHRVNSRPGSVAKFIDLKSLGLGVTRDPSELWTEMSKLLREREPGIFPGALPSPVRPAWFAEKIRQWLSGDDKRRILILLDEADAFLEADGKSNETRDSFRICTEIRDLMVDSRHRFKVVLAGLHNVQRSTRTANNPLAQYGTPICVGPLLVGGEAREAQALIEKPLSRLGIFFESVHLVVRILAQTNYYPNLIQIYCQTLVDHVRERQNRKGADQTVPYRVSSAEVEDIYERKQLRDVLHKRFELTLELDPRFRLIAYLLALHDPESPDGLDSTRIRKEAMEWWEEGFLRTGSDRSEKKRGISLEDFETLLDEMVGLGILRHTGPGATYRLRSPNVVSLLGSESQIEGVLLESEHWEPPKAYSPESFRNPQAVGGISFKSPLTANQEARLKRARSEVILLAGSTALGLDHVGDALGSLFGSDYFHSVVASDLKAFREEVDGLIAKRLNKAEGKTLALVSQHRPWDQSWLDYSADRLSRLRHAGAHFGFVFLLDPAKLWSNWSVFSNWERSQTVSLQPWVEDTIGLWLNDTTICRNTADARAAVYIATGNWPILLHRLAKVLSGSVSDPESLQGQTDSLFQGLATEGTDLRTAFGLDTPEPLRVLGPLFEFGDVPESEASDLLPLADRNLLPAALGWAESLSLIQKRGGEIAIDPFVGRAFARG